MVVFGSNSDWTRLPARGIGLHQATVCDQLMSMLSRHPSVTQSSIIICQREVTDMDVINLDLGLESTHVVVTGGGGLIGRAVVSAFLSAGAKVSCFEISDQAISNLHAAFDLNRKSFHPSSRLSTTKVDISKEDDVIHAFEKAKQEYGTVQCCIALASLDLSVLPHHNSITDMPLDQWRRTFDVNVHGTFLTARTWLCQLRNVQQTSPELKNVSLIIVGSESGSFGERGNADYASGKSAVQGGLLQSLKGDVPRVYPGARCVG